MNEPKCPAVRGPLDATVVPLMVRLRAHIVRMAPHQKERFGGGLLIECLAEIEQLHTTLEELLACGAAEPVYRAKTAEERRAFKDAAERWGERLESAVNAARQVLRHNV